MTSDPTENILLRRDQATCGTQKQTSWRGGGGGALTYLTDGHASTLWLLCQKIPVGQIYTKLIATISDEEERRTPHSKRLNAQEDFKAYIVRGSFKS